MQVNTKECAVNENIYKNHIANYLFWNNFNFSCNLYRHDENSIPVPHCHDDHLELVIVCSGTAYHWLNGHSGKISAGQVFLLKKNDIHTYTKPENLNIYNILFDAHFLQYLQPDIITTPGYKLLFNNISSDGSSPKIKMFIKKELFPQIINLLNGIIDAERKKYPGCQTKIVSDFLQLIYLLSNNIISDEKESGLYLYNISLLTAHLESAFAQDWSLKKMAQYAKIPLSNFRRIFAESMGDPPIRYLLNLRLEKSTKLLLYENDMSIGEIAFLCGFRDLNYFSRQFRKKYAMSPSEFIKKNSIINQ